MHIDFKIYDELFNHFDNIKPIFEHNKYYFKIIDVDGLLYNIVNILNPTQKLQTYEEWNKINNSTLQFNEISSIYAENYMKEFQNYFRQYYDQKSFNFIFLTEKVRDGVQIMH